jgi:dephospho-CoA kinase
MQTQPIHKVALTGGIASGKSTIGNHLKARNVPVIDADDVVHDLFKRDQPLKSQIRQEFGPDVFDPQGEVDRKKLGAIVFSNPQRRKLLESWIHPKVRQTILDFFAQQQALAKKIGVAIIPLLFESNLENGYDEVWLIKCTREQQLERLMKRNNLTREQAESRLASQMTLEEKINRLQQLPKTAVIDNTGSPDVARAQLDQLLPQN